MGEASAIWKDLLLAPGLGPAQCAWLAALVQLAAAEEGQATKNLDCETLGEAPSPRQAVARALIQLQGAKNSIGMMAKAASSSFQNVSCGFLYNYEDGLSLTIA